MSTRKNKRLTTRQREYLLAIHHHMVETGVPPTRRELARTVDVSSLQAVNDQIERLQSKGLLERAVGGGASRDVLLTRAARKLLKLETPGATIERLEIELAWAQSRSDDIERELVETRRQLKTALEIIMTEGGIAIDDDDTVDIEQGAMVIEDLAGWSAWLVDDALVIVDGGVAVEVALTPAVAR